MVKEEGLNLVNEEAQNQEFSDVTRKVNFLFANYFNSKNQRYTYADLERATNGALKYFWIWKLAHNQIERPGLEELQMITDFFGISPKFWFTKLEDWQKQQAQAKVRQEQDKETAKQIALRSVKLRPEAQKIVLGVIESLENNGFGTTEITDEDWE